MQGPSSEVFTAFRNLLALDAKGRLTLEGVRTVVIPAAVLVNIEQAARQILGRGWSSIPYLAGETNGREIASIVRGRMGPDAPPEALLRVIAERTELRGLGRVDVSNVDVALGCGVLTMDASPLAESPARGEAYCYLSAGLWAGVISILAGRNVDAKETECRAAGAPRCTFAFEPTPL